jgi:hypothetical protein
MNNGVRRIVLTTAMAAALSVGIAGATEFHATLDGAQEVPPVPTPGTGDATFSLDDQTNQMSYTINYQNLLAPTTASHLHRAPIGVNGPVVYGLAGPGFPSGHQGVVAINPADIPELMNLGFYINIHTQQFPAGEIRGQVEVTGTPVDPATWGKVKQLYQ